MGTDVDLGRLLEEADKTVNEELARTPEVVPVGHDLDLDEVALVARRWAQVDEVVAVVADLKDSTKLGTGKKAASTASIYEAAIAPSVRVLVEFQADDIDIQGDCVIGVFWGDRRLERAFCSGVTIKTFSARHLEPLIEEKWPDAPPTGFKLGLAASRILVKRIGVPLKEEYQEEVWVGKAVNYAAKAAQESDRGEMWVTGSVWERLESYDYVTYTCGCPNGQPVDSLWEDVEITRLPEGDEDRYGRKLTSMWCVNHGVEFCGAILQGKTDRADVREARVAYGRKQVDSFIAEKRRRARESRQARLRRR